MSTDWRHNESMKFWMRAYKKHSAYWVQKGKKRMAQELISIFLCSYVYIFCVRLFFVLNKNENQRWNYCIATGILASMLLYFPSNNYGKQFPLSAKQMMKFHHDKMILNILNISYVVHIFDSKNFFKSVAMKLKKKVQIKFNPFEISVLFSTWKLNQAQHTVASATLLTVWNSTRFNFKVQH